MRTFQLSEISLDEDSPWDGILASVMFATRATIHTTLQATPSQLVFGRDAILNTRFEADWNIIRQRKQKMSKKQIACQILHKSKEVSGIFFRLIL